MSTNLVDRLKEQDICLCSSEELAKVALEVRAESTQEDVAKRLDVSKQAVSKAEDADIGSSMNGLRIRIIQEIGNFDVDGPYWVVDRDQTSGG